MKTPRFSIRPFQIDKAPSFFRLIENNRNRLEDFFAGTVKENTTLTDSLKFFEQMEIRIQEKTFIPFFLVDTQSNEFIGLVDVKNINWDIPKAELGYFIDKHYEGQGIITIAVGKVIEKIIAEHHFKKLICRVSNKNVASRKVAIRNGFELEGTIRRDYKTTKGEVVDLDYYGRIF